MVKWSCVSITRRGGGPGDHHRWWMASHRLGAEDWGVHLHETQVETLGTYDGLDLVNLAGVEMML